MAVLLSSRPGPKKEIKKEQGTLVQVLTLQRQDKEIIINGTGTVWAAQEVSVIPQVSGQVTYVAPKFVVGGFFNKGEILFEIEDSDYRFALDNAKAAKAKAEYELSTIESQARIARTEWERLNKDSQNPPNPLVLYEPQLKNAKAAFISASASVGQAELDLERTKIKASFNCRVKSENIDLGQYVRTGNSFAVLAGTDTAEIHVPLPMGDMQWLKIPLYNESRNVSLAYISLNIGRKQYTWQGHVVRSTGEVDPKSRMIQLVVEIKDPYGLKSTRDPVRPALAAGTFVDVHIKGETLKGVFVIPRIAFRDNSTVWVMDKDNKLRIKNVKTLRIEKNEVIIIEGLNDGDTIILTNISGAANGMKLRPLKNKKGVIN